MKKDADVVIVGAGAGGLAAGIYLAKAGVRVRIYEQRRQIGGFLTATMQDGAALDVRLPCVCSQGVVFPVLREWGLEPQRIFDQAVWQLAMPGTVIRFDSLENIRYKLQCFYPGEAAALRQYTERMEELVAWLKGGFLPHPAFCSTAGLLKRIVHSIGHPGLSARAVKAFFTSTPHYLASLFTDASLARLLQGLGYPDMSLLLHAGMWYLFLEDYWQPRGGLYGFATQLAELFVRSGGSIYTEMGVAEILTKDGRAEGVRLVNGDVITANYVISSVDYRLTYKVLLTDGISAQIAERLEAKQTSESYLTVCLAIDRMDADEVWCGADHTFVYLDQGMTRGVVLSQTPSSPKLRNVYLSQQCRSGASNTNGGEALITAAEGIVPRLRERIRYQEIWVPSRYEQEFKAYGGASAGWSLHYRQMMGRVFPEWKSHVRNLFHASQWTYSPGGVPAAFLSARQAAHHILNQR